MTTSYKWAGYWVCIILEALAISGCQAQPVPVEPSLYYWKTTLDFGAADREQAKKLGLTTLYVRYFDVDWNSGYGAAVPVGTLKWNYDTPSAAWKDLTIIPTVFITNRTFSKVSAGEVEVLAEKTSQKIQQLSEQLAEQMLWNAYEMDEDEEWEAAGRRQDSIKQAWLGRIKEVQIDCDWTASTKERFFQFLEALKRQDPNLSLSCTLRLHQYRDREQSGIPPVDRAILMCYNTGNIRNVSEDNAILDSRVVSQYLQGKAYPLPLDAALPLFSWGVWFRGETYQGLLQGWDEAYVQKQDFLTRDSKNRYRVLKDTVVGPDYLREGDLVRVDGPAQPEVEKSVQLLKTVVSGNQARLVFFDWNLQNIRSHEQAIRTYLAAFR